MGCRAGVNGQAETQHSVVPTSSIARGSVSAEASRASWCAQRPSAKNSFSSASAYCPLASVSEAQRDRERQRERECVCGDRVSRKRKEIRGRECQTNEKGIKRGREPGECVCVYVRETVCGKEEKGERQDSFRQ